MTKLGLIEIRAVTSLLELTYLRIGFNWDRGGKWNKNTNI